MSLSGAGWSPLLSSSGLPPSFFSTTNSVRKRSYQHSFTPVFYKDFLFVFDLFPELFVVPHTFLRLRYTGGLRTLYSIPSVFYFRTNQVLPETQNRVVTTPQYLPQHITLITMVTCYSMDPSTRVTVKINLKKKIC